MNGSCHCGAVRFHVEGEPTRALACNCSMCARVGFLHWIVQPEAFTLLEGARAITTYTFGTHTAKHTFCSLCGVKPFYTPRSHPDQISVNVRCLEGLDLGQIEIEPFDGANWEQNVESIR